MSQFIVSNLVGCFPCFRSKSESTQTGYCFVFSEFQCAVWQGMRKVKIKEKRQGKNKKKRKRKKDRRKKNFSFRKVSSIIGFVKQNGMVIRRLLGEVQALICYLLPTKVCGEMIVGTGDPASTGLMIGGLSLFPVVYQEKLKITPDFEEKRFEAKGYIKGRLRMIYFVRLLLRLYKDRELKHLWKQFNQVKKEAA